MGNSTIFWGWIIDFKWSRNKNEWQDKSCLQVYVDLPVEKCDTSVNKHIPFVLFSRPQTAKVVVVYILGDPISLTLQDTFISSNQKYETINL